MPPQFSPPLKYGVTHARMVWPSVRIRTRFPLVRRVLSSVIGSQLISDYISATRCSVVTGNASTIFSATQVWGRPCVKGLSQCTDKNMIHTRAQSSGACFWLTILISDCISSMRRTVVLCKSPTVISDSRTQ